MGFSCFRRKKFLQNRVVFYFPWATCERWLYDKRTDRAGHPLAGGRERVQNNRRRTGSFDQFGKKLVQAASCRRNTGRRLQTVWCAFDPVPWETGKALLLGSVPQFVVVCPSGEQRAPGRVQACLPILRYRVHKQSEGRGVLRTGMLRQGENEGEAR